MEYLNCGKAYKNNNVSNYRVTKFSDLSEKIIPFDPFWGRFLPSGGNFKKYPLVGIKSKDFEDFCIVVEMMTVYWLAGWLGSPFPRLASFLL